MKSATSSFFSPMSSFRRNWQDGTTVKIFRLENTQMFACDHVCGKHLHLKCAICEHIQTSTQFECCIRLLVRFSFDLCMEYEDIRTQNHQIARRTSRRLQGKLPQFHRIVRRHSCNVLLRKPAKLIINECGHNMSNISIGCVNMFADSFRYIFLHSLLSLSVSVCLSVKQNFISFLQRSHIWGEWYHKYSHSFESLTHQFCVELCLATYNWGILIPLFYRNSHWQDAAHSFHIYI